MRQERWNKYLNEQRAALKCVGKMSRKSNQFAMCFEMKMQMYAKSNNAWNEGWAEGEIAGADGAEFSQIYLPTSGPGWESVCFLYTSIHIYFLVLRKKLYSSTESVARLAPLMTYFFHSLINTICNCKYLFALTYVKVNTGPTHAKLRKINKKHFPLTPRRIFWPRTWRCQHL